MSKELQTKMEAASVALVQREYLKCERLCMESMAIAFAANDFDTYARILLPLQESRRLRRQTAEDAGVFVVDEKMDAGAILDAYGVGCLVLVRPVYGEGDLDALKGLRDERGSFVEAILLDGDEIKHDALKAQFLAELERLGDEAIAGVGDLVGVERVKALEGVVAKVGDHEKAHQRLADAARAV